MFLFVFCFQLILNFSISGQAAYTEVSVNVRVVQFAQSKIYEVEISEILGNKSIDTFTILDESQIKVKIGEKISRATLDDYMVIYIFDVDNILLGSASLEFRDYEDEKIKISVKSNENESSDIQSSIIESSDSQSSKSESSDNQSSKSEISSISTSETSSKSETYSGTSSNEDTTNSESVSNDSTVAISQSSSNNESKASNDETDTSTDNTKIDSGSEDENTETTNKNAFFYPIIIFSILIALLTIFILYSKKKGIKYE